jgi:hypothetical protein
MKIMKVLLISLLTLIIVVGAAWWIVRPGVFTVQPLGAFPEGVTFIYHSRGPEMPVFASPDGLCLKLQGSVSVLCRMAGLTAVTPLVERILLRLPYNQTAYLLSTDGQTFDH